MVDYYGYNYGFEPGIGNAGSAAGAVLGFFLVFYLLFVAFGVVSYVLQSWGMHTIAKRRGIRNPWLAWLPVGNMWILGSISDQYQYVAKGRVRNRRGGLLWLTVAMLVFCGLIVGSVFATVFSRIVGIGTGGGNVIAGASVGVMLLAYFVLFVISVVAAVIQYMALYDLYVSCEPGNGVLYLILSIFISVVMPFFIFACRKKDLGMPPRKTKEPVVSVEIPVSEAPVEETAVEEDPVEE